jgi:hypothetical protein
MLKNLEQNLLIPFELDPFLINFLNSFGHEFFFRALQTFIHDFFNNFSLFSVQKYLKQTLFDRRFCFNQSVYEADIRTKMNRSRLDPPTIKLDKGRGSRTLSIKTLPRLVPLVTCFNCFEGNILVIKNKSLINI